MSSPLVKVFDYRALRLMMGLIAMSLPFVVTFRANLPLSSISASYYTAARDLFVGQLFVVGAFLWAYRGQTRFQAVASKVASLAAVCVALFPTPPADQPATTTGYIHFAAAGILFLILTYFCFVPFMGETWGGKVKEMRRAIVYLFCGSAMVLSMLTLLYAWLFMEPKTVEALKLVYYGEAMALIAFGFAWMVSGKFIPYFADEDEALRLF